MLSARKNFTNPIIYDLWGRFSDSLSDLEGGINMEKKVAAAARFANQIFGSMKVRQIAVL